MSELEQTIEELEAEVLAELEEASDAQTKGAAPAEGKKKIDAVTPGGKVADVGGADPEAKVEKGADEDRGEKCCCQMHWHNQSTQLRLLLLLRL